MDHLQDAKMYVRRAEDNLDVGMMQAHAQLAIAHGIIALVEQRNKAAKDAEIAAEHADLICERLAQRRASKRIL